MNKKFNFENNLTHQLNAVADIMQIFNNAETEIDINREKNPLLKNIHFGKNLMELQAQNEIFEPLTKSNVIDIQMETGTGKTYTYTRAMFELNRELGIYKFVVVVPTLAIKAGTKAFFEQSRERFYDDFGKEVKLYEVKSQKSSKKKKEQVPSALLNFVNENNTNNIHILLINQGMLNSKTMDYQVEQDLFGECFSSAFESLSAVRPLMIIDEPHRFKTDRKTWQNIEKIKAQNIIRFGATFDTYENLIHRLTSLDAFNQNLVKGVRAFVVDFKEANNTYIQFKGWNVGKDAILELKESKKKTLKTVELAKNEDLGALHSELNGIKVTGIKASAVELSNGLTLTKSDTISPYSFSQSLQMDMLEQAVKQHFKIEKELLTRKGVPRIKPLSLFFIDDISGYRGETSNEPESLKNRFEALVKNEAEALLKTETDEFYRVYLENTLKDISSSHGGYFSQDNSEKDEKIEAEINRILHDKQALLSLNEPHRFIFSKWTLREGWDNPNVFQICKLRSSGSEISKLQEVGRGLRLPVNEFMNREKTEQFYLNYFVDFNETDFVDNLINEIKENSVFDKPISQLNNELKEKIKAVYPKETNRAIGNKLYDCGAIDDDDKFTANGWKKMLDLYPLAFTQLQKGKVVNATDKKTSTTKIRKAQYQELKHLWESINQRVILNYQIKNENEFEALLLKFFKDEIANQSVEKSVKLEQKTLKTQGNEVTVTIGNTQNLKTTHIQTMNYAEFSLRLAKQLSVNLMTLHKVFSHLNIDLSVWQNQNGLRTIHQTFKKWLLHHFLTHHQVAYQKVSNHIHPTAFTNADGSPKTDLSSADIGRLGGKQVENETYLFDKVFFDSGLEEENILTHLEEVIVFTKIPRNTIRIPVAGGGTYSPDFAYVLKKKDGEQTLNLVVETKDTDSPSLRKSESEKIKYAKLMFNQLMSDSAIQVRFKTQFEAEKIQRIIEDSFG